MRKFDIKLVCLETITSLFPPRGDFPEFDLNMGADWDIDLFPMQNAYRGFLAADAGALKNLLKGS